MPNINDSIRIGFNQKDDLYQKVEFRSKRPISSQKVEFDPEIFVDKKTISVKNSNFDQKSISNKNSNFDQKMISTILYCNQIQDKVPKVDQRIPQI